MVPLIFVVLFSGSFGFHLDLNKSEEIKTHLGAAFEMINQKNQTLDSLEESLKKFTQGVEDLIKEISEDSAVFLENLEHEKINQLLQLFDSAPCVGVHELEGLKKSFRIELGLLEVPVRETIVELSDKFVEMKRLTDIERSLYGVKLASCLFINTTNCTNEIIKTESPCLNDSCSPAQTVVMTHNMSITNTTDQSVQTKPTLSVRNWMSTECESVHYRCENGQCIRFDYACDGAQDCTDGTDEVVGCTRNCPEKRCRNLNCITEDKICDGVDDCGDGTDEAGCLIYNEANCNMTAGNFLCSNKKHCIPLTEICNGRSDCNDGTDEDLGCSNTTGCMNCASVGGACLQTPSGPLCLRKCPVDYVLDLSTGICVNKVRPNTDPIITHNSISFLGITDKLNVLSKRFIKGYILLKKHMYQVMQKSVLNLNKCRQENKNQTNSLSNPFFIV